MSRINDEKIAELLLRAQERGACWAPSKGDSDSVRRAMARRVAEGSVISPARGLFVDAEVWQELRPSQRSLMIARGMQALHPSWVFCGPTAALAYGIDVSETLTKRVHVATVPKGCGTNRGVVQRHPVLVESSMPGGIEVVDGLRVTSPDQTVFDCLRWTDFPRGLGVIDSALRAGVVCKEEFEEYALSMSSSRRKAKRALAALAWADPRSESGGESIARGRMLLLGYVCPELQVEVPKVIERGEPFRADFCWVRADGLVILGELDGTCKYTDEEMMGGRSLGEVLSDENVRGSRFSLYDVSLLRFGFGVTENPTAFSRLLDEYGVPKRGSALALPDGVPMVPNWDALRRNKG